MKKIKNNLITLSLSLLAIFVFSLVTSIPQKANAEYMQFSKGQNGLYGGTSDNSINPLPVIYSINPNSKEACSGAKDVNISGKNFIPDSVARFNGSDRPTTYISSTQLTIKLSDNDICKASGNYYINVYNPMPGGGLSNSVIFTLTPSTASGSTNTKTTVAHSTTKKTVAKASSKQVACASGTGSDNSNLTANALFASNNFMPSNIFQWLLLFVIILLIVIITRKIVAKEKPLKHA